MSISPSYSVGARFTPSVSAAFPDEKLILCEISHFCSRKLISREQAPLPPLKAWENETQRLCIDETCLAVQLMIIRAWEGGQSHQRDPHRTIFDFLIPQQLSSHNSSTVIWGFHFRWGYGLTAARKARLTPHTSPWSQNEISLQHTHANVAVAHYRRVCDGGPHGLALHEHARTERRRSGGSSPRPSPELIKRCPRKVAYLSAPVTDAWAHLEGRYEPFNIHVACFACRCEWAWQHLRRNMVECFKPIKKTRPAKCHWR